MTITPTTEQLSRQYLLDLSNEIRLADDAAQLLQERGLDRPKFVKALKEQGLPVPRTATAIQRLVLSDYPQLVNSGLPFVEIAQQLGLSEPTLRYNVKTLGLSLPQSTTYQKALRVREYLERCGGTINEAIRSLNLQTSPRYIRAHLQEMGFTADDYRFAYQRHGDWIVQVGSIVRKDNSDWLVPAKCIRCGEVFTVSYSNIRNGNSHCCHVCASRSREQRTVLCTTDGTIYRSLNQMVRSLSDEDLGYQTIRKSLMRTGEFTSKDGRTFRFYHGDAAPNYVADAEPTVKAVEPAASVPTGRPQHGVSKLRELALLGDY